MKVVDIQTVSAETGLSVLAIRKLVRSNELPYLFLGNPDKKKGKYYFNLDMVNDALAEMMVKDYQIGISN